MTETPGLGRIEKVDALARELHIIGERCARLVGPGAVATAHGDALYDERGLPA